MPGCYKSGVSLRGLLPDPAPRMCGVLWLIGLLLIGECLRAEQFPRISAPIEHRVGLLRPTLPDASGNGCPSDEVRELDSVHVSDKWFPGILPEIGNLQIGYLSYFGPGNRTGLLVMDYFLPVRLDPPTVLFGELHTRVESIQHFLSGSDGKGNGLVLLGLGIRRRFQGNFMVGLNGFCNRTRVAGKWYRSGILGAEYAMITYGGGVASLTTNVYADFFGGKDGFFHLIRRAADIRVEGAYYQPVVKDLLDLKVKLNWYLLHQGIEKDRGWSGGLELLTADGRFRGVFEKGYDKLNGGWNSIGLYLNVGIDFSKLLSWEVPLLTPALTR